MTVTLQAIEAKHAEVAAMIATYKDQQPTSYRMPEAMIELARGEDYAGIVLDDEGNPSHHVILLPGEIEGADWEAANAWAEQQGGDLPTRREQALLYANCKAKFQPRAYWSVEEHESDSGYAWYQTFGYGLQYGYHESFGLRARAVRRLVID